MVAAVVAVVVVVVVAVVEEEVEVVAARAGVLVVVGNALTPLAITPTPLLFVQCMFYHPLSLKLYKTFVWLKSPFFVKFGIKKGSRTLKSHQPPHLTSGLTSHQISKLNWRWIDWISHRRRGRRLFVFLFRSRSLLKTWLREISILQPLINRGVRGDLESPLVKTGPRRTSIGGEPRNH